MMTPAPEEIKQYYGDIFEQVTQNLPPLFSRTKIPIYSYIREDEVINKNKRSIAQHPFHKDSYVFEGQSVHPNSILLEEIVSSSARVWPIRDALFTTDEKEWEYVKRVSGYNIPYPSHHYIVCAQSIDRVAKSARDLYDFVVGLLKKNAYLVILEPTTWLYADNIDRPYERHNKKWPQSSGDDYILHNSYQQYADPIILTPNSQAFLMLEMMVHAEKALVSERTLLRDNGASLGPVRMIKGEKIEQFVKLVEEGKTQREISQIMNISQATVSRYISDHVTKTGRGYNNIPDKNPAELREKRREYSMKHREKQREMKLQEVWNEIKDGFGNRTKADVAKKLGISEKILTKMMSEAAELYS